MSVESLLDDFGLHELSDALRALRGKGAAGLEGLFGGPSSQLVRGILGRASSVELVGASLAHSLGLREVSELDLRHAGLLLSASEPEEGRLREMLGQALRTGAEVRAVLLISSSLGTLFALSLLEEAGQTVDLLRRVREEEEEVLEASIRNASQHFAGREGLQEALISELEKLSDLLRYISMTDEDLRVGLEALLGGGETEAERSLGSARLTMLQEEFHVRRVNALRRAGFGLAAAQRIAELHGGTVRGAWGC